jgi:hypothetical protein
MIRKFMPFQLSRVVGRYATAQFSLRGGGAAFQRGRGLLLGGYVPGATEIFSVLLPAEQLFILFKRQSSTSGAHCDVVSALVVFLTALFTRARLAVLRSRPYRSHDFCFSLSFNFQVSGGE